MKINKIVTWLLIAVLIFGIFLIPCALFKLSFARFVLTQIPSLVVLGGFSLVLAFIISKNKKLGALLTVICLLVISSMVLFFRFMDNLDAEKVEWNAPTDRFTMDFMVGREGYIYLKASVNDTSGLFLFDTGCTTSHVNERLVTNKMNRLHQFTITDAHGVQQTKHLYKVNRFELGDVEIKQLHVYPSDSLTWTQAQGTFYRQDSVMGIIGNNIISRFVWDFDMINKRVILSRSKKYCKDLADSLSLPLFSNNGNKDIAVKINGVEKRLTFDFGAAHPLCISDTIPYLLATDKKGFTQISAGLLNHLDSTERKENNFDFAEVKFGAYTFKDIICSEKAHCNLLGIPFMWTFERVIVDYMNDKAYFINKNDDFGGFSLVNFNRKNIWYTAREIKFDAKPGGREVHYTKAGIKKRLVFYGNFTLFKNSEGLDSIFYQDSMSLANGQKKYGPSAFKFEE